MPPRLPDDREVQRLLLPELKSRGLMFQGHLAEAGPRAEELVRGAWQEVADELGIEPRQLNNPVDFVDARLRYLFVGTPGGGTTWFSRLLTALGTPCGHESVFRACGVPRAKRVVESSPWSECSGFASQWLPQMQLATYCGLICHPVGACNSMIGHLHWPASMAIEYWIQTHDREWGVWCRLERCYQMVADITGRPIEHVEHLATKIDRNAHTYSRELVWEDLPLGVRSVALERYGYTKEGLDGAGKTE